jgi:hypothetical protein
MRTRTVILAAALLLLGFGIFVWRRNISLRRELVLAQGKLAEQEALQEQSEADLQERENHKRSLLENEKAALSNRVNRLEAQLLTAQKLHDQRATTQGTKPPQSSPEESAEQLTTAVLQGDFAALDTLAAMTRKAASANRPDMTSDEQEKLVAGLRPIWAAFDTLADQASQGNQNALQALAKAARIPELSGLAIKSLGQLAGRGSEGALNIVLDPQRFGIDVPFSSTVSALKPAAESGNPRAIEALAAVAADDNQQPLWFMAADALRKPAESGNSVAIEALISFSRSTNQSVLNAVRIGLGAAAANQNERVAEALRNLNARQTAH